MYTIRLERFFGGFRSKNPRPADLPDGDFVILFVLTQTHIATKRIVCAVPFLVTLISKTKSYAMLYGYFIGIKICIFFSFNLKHLYIL
jgi:hypothetical protein